jgi:hypothetical protein
MGFPNAAWPSEYNCCYYYNYYNYYYYHHYYHYVN